MKLPKSVQQAIPIQRLWQDGTFQFGSKFSQSVRFSDINYAIASKSDKTQMFLGYSELLNALDTGAATKITIHNRRIEPPGLRPNHVAAHAAGSAGRLPSGIQPDAPGQGHRPDQQRGTGAIHHPARRIERTTRRPGAFSAVPSVTSPATCPTWAPAVSCWMPESACGCSTTSTVPARNPSFSST